MKNKIINTAKGLLGYLFFVFIVTIFINVTGRDDETGKHPEQLITLTEFLVNCVSFAAMLGIIGLLIVFFEDHKYSFKYILLYFFLLYIFSLYISAPGGITDIDHIPYDLISNSFTYFFIFSFISFFIILKAFTSKNKS